MKKIKFFETMNSLQDLTILESKENDSLVHLEGVFGVCGVLNNNNRIYTKENYSEMVDSVQEQIAKKAFLGTLEHDISLGINLQKVSHRVDSLSIDEDGVVRGSITLLNTPNGNIAKSIIESGSPLYVSSKAIGTIDENNIVTLTQLFGYDLVGSPGFSEAEVNLKENETFESINENICFITEAEDKEDEPKDKEDEPKDKEDEPETDKEGEETDKEDEKDDKEKVKEEEKEDNKEEKTDKEEPKEDKEDDKKEESENLESKTEENSILTTETVEQSSTETDIKEDNIEENKTDNYKNISRNKTMNKHFYLAEAFRAAINRQTFGEELSGILKEAKDEMSKSIVMEGANLNVIPFAMLSEVEDAPAWPIQGHELNATVDDTHGKALVHTQYGSPLMPVMEDNILGEFTWFTGLRGTFATNRFGAATAYWKGELKKADPTKMKFDAIEAKPKRLTTYVDISKQELIQSDYNLESYIRDQINEAITLKLQSTILGDGAGDDVTPKGLFYGATQLANTNFATLVGIEKDAKVNGVRRATKYFINPETEATLRTQLKSEVAGAQYMIENDKLIGKDYIVSNDVAGLAYGDPKTVAICVWGPGIEINFNPYTLDLYDAYRFTVNMYVDVLYLNPLKGEEDNATAVPQFLAYKLQGSQG